MKSRRLVSDGILADEDDDEFLDGELAGEELVAALQRYSQYKRAAAALLERHEEHAGRIYRRLPVPDRFLRRRDDAAQLPAARLADSLAVLLAEPPVPDVSHITDIAVSVVRELRRLRGLLETEGEFSFAAVAPRDRLEKAVTFFALLELHNSGEARLRQSRAFADIVVERLGPVRGGATGDELTAVG
jgi:chromatin segregation and condensation protein Rec8/ScpA/Scc1 (kleisin family)